MVSGCYRAAGGELQKVLDLEEGLEEQEAVKVMRQILEGLCFLHNNNIAHLDLKVSTNTTQNTSHQSTIQKIKLCRAHTQQGTQIHEHTNYKNRKRKWYSL